MEEKDKEGMKWKVGLGKKRDGICVDNCQPNNFITIQPNFITTQPIQTAFYYFPNFFSLVSLNGIQLNCHIKFTKIDN